jgi:hypothetical protein
MNPVPSIAILAINFQVLRLKNYTKDDFARLSIAFKRVKQLGNLFPSINILFKCRIFF